MALSVSIGILVDDAIVVLENVHRHLEQGESPMEAALRGTAEVGPAVVAATLSIFAVFVPIAFMQGMVGRFFFEYGLTVVFAVAVSLLVALTLTPEPVRATAAPRLRDRTRPAVPRLRPRLRRAGARLPAAARARRCATAWWCWASRWLRCSCAIPLARSIPLEFSGDAWTAASSRRGSRCRSAPGSRRRSA